MRRVDKEIKDQAVINRIISNSQVCRLGLSRDNVPYVIPVSFGYDGAAFYIHTAHAGRKIEFFEANPVVCLEFEHAVTLKSHESEPCSWSFSFQSVVGYGIISELTDPAEINTALRVIMKQYSPGEWSFSEAGIAGVRVWKIAVESLSGKQSKDLMPQ
ncbi:MAG: pyridoxamine 5'-phosphate oxidase family protein [Desulfuromonadaceae bacterium]|nr:pyridoxamine 5'-phosphate oxidase family protein [Desulfuromonadaceae bacterium]